MTTLTIVSGGQTGVDRAALDAALDHGVPCGGWCPEGRLAEDGAIPERYPLQELPFGGYRERTLQNVLDSDGTLIVHAGPMRGGTRLTADFCAREAQPFLCVDAAGGAPEEWAGEVLAFLRAHDIRRLNVAGPRGSGAPKLYAFAYRLVECLLGAS